MRCDSTGGVPLKRKLTTILVADAQGYSKLMAADEAATLDRLQRCRSIMSGLFERHDGRQVNTWGDAIIAEFPSVVEAVRCAVEIQDAVSGENHGLAKAQQMHFRIGINLGDVIIDGDDLYGDGVNVAARLQSLAEPDGIMVSGTVYGLAHKQLAIAFDFAGDQAVKNLDEPVPAYRVRMADRNRPEATADTHDDAKGEGQAPASDSRFTRGASQLEALWIWLTNQPRRVRVAAFMIAFFFAINLLFSGIAKPWFIFPAAPFALYIFLHVRRDQRRQRRHSER
jgi:adenylate cyclase